MVAAPGAATGGSAPLALTGHPFQRNGAWAVAVLAGRGEPAEVSVADLDAVAGQLVEDVCTAATAAKESAAYAWWKVLFALYPNSKATHSKRPSDPAALRPGIAEMFALDLPEPSGGGTAPAPRPCTFCGAQARAIWTKSRLPLFDTDKALNTLPPGVSGWPVCRGCRVALWALPYGAWVTAGSATALTCEDRAVERRFAAGNVRRARRIMHLGFDGLPATARPELVVVSALRRLRGDAPSTAVLWSFKNDNQEPWLRVSRTRRATGQFLATVDGDPTARAGWNLLCRALDRREKSGRKTTDGREEAARHLFENDDGRSRSLLSLVHGVLGGAGTSTAAKSMALPLSPFERGALSRLALTYVREIYAMEPKTRAAAQLLADWIEHGSASPRGKFAEYRAAALKPYPLGQLLMQAQARLLLDGRATAVSPDDLAALLGQRPGAWEQRMLLFFAVTELLAQRGVRLGEQDPEDDEERIEQLVSQQPLGPGGHDDELHDEHGDEYEDGAA